VSRSPGTFNIGQSLSEALALQRQGRLREAEKIYARVLKAVPDNFDALNLLGTIKAQLGRLGEAHRLLTAAIKSNPRVPQVHANLGQVLAMLKRHAEALACFDKALALAPGDLNIRNNRANALLSLERPREALDELRKVLAGMPQHPEARLNSGIAHAALGLSEEAVAEFDRALTLVPGHPAAHYNRGIALYDLGRYAAAVDAHDDALKAAPEHAGAWLNRGRALAALNRLDDAVASYGKAAAIRKDDPDAQFMESLALLARGDYRRGFEKYEARWRRSGMPAPPRRGQPLWRGDYPLARKTVMLHAEQGLGDTIQFARYVPLLAEAGATVMLEVPGELAALMAPLQGATAIIRRGETAAPFDVHCPLGTLPLAFKTEPDTVPANVPYLAADEAHLAKWSQRLGALPRPRIAVAWAGNPNHLNDRNRSMALAQLEPLFAAPAVFLSIQRDLREADRSMLAAQQRITHLGGDLDDFADTAAVIALSDLVIAVDTAVVHLAGAMGRPVWVLVPFAPDWRWGLEGDSTAWYPTARLFRQTALGDWDGVVARLGAELAQFTPAAALRAG
jgi:tetratricopeptide (TPR) repeat protein